MLLHLYAVLVAVSTAVLIFAGGLVTSTGSGLSVPDWPTTYGWFMFTFPLEKMVGGIRFEHTHRLIASTVGFLILVLAVWLRLAEPRRWVRRLGYVALRRRHHAGHPRRHHRPLVPARSDLDRAREPGTARLLPDDFHRAGDIARMEARLFRCAARHPTIESCSASPLATTGLVYLQILIGATMRHTDAGLAIPDFPLAFGHLLPPAWDPKIAVHFAHRVGALVVTLFAIATTGHVFFHHRSRPELWRPSALLLVLLACRSRSAR